MSLQVAFASPAEAERPPSAASARSERSATQPIPRLPRGATTSSRPDSGGDGDGPSRRESRGRMALEAGSLSAVQEDPDARQACGEGPGGSSPSTQVGGTRVVRVA